MTVDLFDDEVRDVELALGAMVLGGFARPFERPLLAALERVVEAAPFRHMVTPGGRRPPMPDAFEALAIRAAVRAGFDGFVPDACLVNRYEPGARLSLPHDRNERDFDAPIVTVSLGLPALFLFGGERRADVSRRVRLVHGDVVVWGGPARLRFHGVMPLEEGHPLLLGGRRVNLTFRKAT